MKVGYDLTTEEIDAVWGNANFGSHTRLDIVRQGILKCASGYYQGHTSMTILKELGLITKGYKLTTRGEKNLYELFYDKNVNV